MTAEPLLGPGDPAPFTILKPEGRSDVVFTADHAGRITPHRLGDLGVSAAEWDRHIACDIGIAGVTRQLATLMDATAILQTYSRLVIDCNRAPSMESSIPLISEATEIPGNVDLDPAAREARCAEIFWPYQNAIQGILDTRKKAGRRTIFVAMHSFTPVYLGERRDIHIGVLYNRDPRLAHALIDLLRAEGDLIVGDNAPYSLSDDSDYSVPVHGERRGLLHVEVEIRQDLIADPAGQTRWAERFARILTLADARLPGA